MNENLIASEVIEILDKLFDSWEGVQIRSDEDLIARRITKFMKKQKSTSSSYTGGSLDMFGISFDHFLC